MVNPAEYHEPCPDSELDICLAIGDQQTRKVVAATLELLTHNVVFSTDSGDQMLEHCLEAPPDVAIVGTGLVGMNCYELLNEISDLVDCPAIAIVQNDELDRAKRLMHDELMGILVEPVSKNHLRPAIYLARRRYSEMKGLEQEVQRLEKELDRPQQRED